MYEPAVLGEAEPFAFEFKQRSVVVLFKAVYMLRDGGLRKMQPSDRKSVV